MINLRITGLYNRGQQDEYVELEAAARCDLEGLMLVRYLYNAEGSRFIVRSASMSFPIRIFARETESVSILVSPKRRKSVLQKE
mgnify:CR=1 FL=1|jgi:hypothetical protein